MDSFCIALHCFALRCDSMLLGLQKLTQISSLVRDEAKGNVHSGGPPPWFNSTEGKQLDEKLKPGLGMIDLVSPVVLLKSFTY